MELLVPEEYCKAMSVMYQSAPETEWEKTRATIESQLGKKVEEVFSELEHKPVSSASIAQVHFGKLKTGEQVAVKVQHPWLAEEVTIDIKMTETLVNLGMAIFKDFNYGWLIKDMKLSLPQELDFRIEAENAIKSRKLFEDNEKVKIPKIYKKHSTVIFLCKILEKSYDDGVC